MCVYICICVCVCVYSTHYSISLSINHISSHSRYFSKYIFRALIFLNIRTSQKLFAYSKKALDSFTLFLSPNLKPSEIIISFLLAHSLHNCSCSYFKTYTRQLAVFRQLITNEESKLNKLRIGAIKIRKIGVK